MLWATAACLGSAVLVWSQGNPLEIEPAQPLLFFLACVSCLSTLLAGSLAVLFGVLASCWRPPVEPGTGLSGSQRV